MMMAAADHSGTGPDHYQLLGVPRDASREQIAQAWRRRARDEHPDAQPCDADAPARFRVLAEAWQVLSDPSQRAAYDRSLAPGQTAGRAPAARVPVRRLAGTGAIGTGGRAAGPPLWAGPVQIDGRYLARPAGDLARQEAQLAILTELALRYLARDRDPDWPW